MAKPKSKPQKQPKSEAPPKPPPNTPPPWPPLKLPLPLRAEPHPSAADKIVLIPNFFTPALCRAYLSVARGLPLATTPGRPKRGDAVRVNDRFQIDDAAFAGRLFEAGLRDLLEDQRYAHLWGGQVVGLNPNIRVYRYSKSQFFDCHYDDSNNVTLPTGPARTTWTLLLYLTSSSPVPKDGECSGGETVFYPRGRRTERDALAFAPEAGTVLLHKHGDECMLRAYRKQGGKG
ncbi:uncharacterized protein DNG_03000 [Cephalotrichum gorgonifer]|uniref:Prolyl 4-hydroxylase alpha subunit domain-containing protein n=1 Tax=Cephalotrichum gorgonifer TaxID=2041049 RepID=A0AAE8ST53_9PEZI|nr:uncharacterized protein DNG_03000 [Cephalotrichum gorgonifer]